MFVKIVDFPDPETPVRQVKQDKGSLKERFFKLCFLRFLRESAFLRSGVLKGGLGKFFLPERKAPVNDFLSFRICCEIIVDENLYVVFDIFTNATNIFLTNCAYATCIPYYCTYYP